MILDFYVIKDISGVIGEIWMGFLGGEYRRFLRCFCNYFVSLILLLDKLFFKILNSWRNNVEYDIVLN